MNNDPNTRQVGGSHYQGEYQHWDYATDLCMRHLEGAATKYLARFGNKPDATALQDLEKAAHYLEKLATLYAEGRIRTLFDVQVAMLRLNHGGKDISADEMSVYSPYTARFLANITGYALKPHTMAALVLLAHWCSGDQLAEVQALVAAQLNYERGRPQPKHHSEEKIA